MTRQYTCGDLQEVARRAPAGGGGSGADNAGLEMKLIRMLYTLETRMAHIRQHTINSRHDTLPCFGPSSFLNIEDQR